MKWYFMIVLSQGGLVRDALVRYDSKTGNFEAR